MVASCFFPNEKVEFLFKERWLLSLFAQEKKGQESELKSWLPDKFIWDGLDYFLRGNDGSDASFLSRSLPYVGPALIINYDLIGARPLNTPFKAKIRQLLQKLGKDMEALQLPLDFLACDQTKKFQADLARYWFLASLEELIPQSGEPLSEEFQYYLEQARQTMRDAETEFLFCVKRHLDRTPCGDCKGSLAQIIPLAKE